MVGTSFPSVLHSFMVSLGQLGNQSFWSFSYLRDLPLHLEDVPGITTGSLLLKCLPITTLDSSIFPDKCHLPEKIMFLALLFHCTGWIAVGLLHSCKDGGDCPQLLSLCILPLALHSSTALWYPAGSSCFPVPADDTSFIICKAAQIHPRNPCRRYNQQFEARKKKKKMRTNGGDASGI